MSQAREAYSKKEREVELLDTSEDHLDFCIMEAASDSVVSGLLMAACLALIPSEVVWPIEERDSKSTLGAVLTAINIPFFSYSLSHLIDALKDRWKQSELRSREVEIRNEFRDCEALLRRCEREAARANTPLETQSKSQARKSIRKRNIRNTPRNRPTKPQTKPGKQFVRVRDQGLALKRA